MQKWFLNVWVIGFFLTALQEPHAQQNDPQTQKPPAALFSEKKEPAEKAPAPNMEERSLGIRGVLKVPEPEFIQKGTSARAQGVYFGVGFQQVHLDFLEGIALSNRDAATNGVAFNLGYSTPQQAFEYVRHVVLLDVGETLVQAGQRFNFVEVTQSNWWYLRRARLTVDWSAHYGLGLQVAETRLIFQNFETPAEKDSKVYRENSLIAGLGSSYFLAPSFFVQYRFTYGRYSSFLTGSQAAHALSSTQNHTLFLQYYFSL